MGNPDWTIERIRAVGQPPDIRGRRTAEHWSAALYLRRLSPYLTRALLPTGISANGVTVLMMLTGWAAAACVLIPGLPGAVLAAVLAQMQMLVDASDGEVARVRGTTGAGGVFLDKIGHYTTEALIPIALGIRAAGGWDVSGGWMYAGAVLAVIVLWNKSLNEMADATRYHVGLAQQPDTTENQQPQAGAIGSLRRVARLVPFYRIWHSVELTLVILAAAAGDAIAGDLVVTRWVLLALVPLAALSALGHAVAILASNRLR